ncbi:type IV pilus assembly protein PilV [Variovorax sp. YR634]|uniref:type IV pilus modification protein PilV n=1 Tax=Variovorax sp. YR634 TaxID=1884385 RepID=UPI0008960C3C|nr:type IV pilus modification protein PilV [Variovorax sp. YR634]SDX73406.1 type IV pilus assembly protein PilV [Variovorax sp. YR634]
MNAHPHHRGTRRASAPRARKDQRGIVLLEALVALLIFSVGVLGLIGLQATSVKQASAAEYRSTAVLQANDLISRMWVSDRSDTVLQAQFAATGDGYKAWKDAWTSALPGTTSNPPDVVIKSEDKGAAATLGTNTVTITIYWQAPGDDKRQYTMVARLDQPQK